MPLWLKIVIGMVVALMLLVAACIYAAKSFIATGEARFEEAAVAGTQYGEANGHEACVSEAARRASDCHGAITCLPTTANFTWACLESAPPDPEFCADIPIVDEERMEWAEATCILEGYGDDESCAFALSIVPAYCQNLAES